MNRTPPSRVLSSNPVLFKRVIPALCGLAALTIVIFALRDGDVAGTLFVAAIFVIGLLLSRVLGAQFADEVRDGGDFLRIRLGDLEEDISFQEIESVKEPLWHTRIPRIEVVRVAPGKLGRVIAFIPVVYSLLPFQRSTLTLELEERIERAKREKARSPRH